MENKKTSPFPNLDRKLEKLAENKKRWLELSLNKKIEYLESIRENISKVYIKWAKDSLRFKVRIAFIFQSLKHSLSLFKGVDPDLPENYDLLSDELIYFFALGGFINNFILILKNSDDLGGGKIELEKPKIFDVKNVKRKACKGSALQLLISRGKKTEKKSFFFLESFSLKACRRLDFPTSIERGNLAGRRGNFTGQVIGRWKRREGVRSSWGRKCFRTSCNGLYSQTIR